MNAKRKNFYVPWSDVSEWNSVRNQILSSNITDTIKAYETISMWKLKYDNLPAYLESTFSLLQVLIKEYKIDKENKTLSIFEEHDLQLAYSAALIRFVNHVSSVCKTKNETLYWAAKIQNIPDWIINMRHEAAHSQNLPPLDALHVAAEHSLNWLLDNYWENGNDTLRKSCEIVNVNPVLNTERNVHADPLFKKFFKIWDLYIISKKKYFGEMNRDFIVHLKELFQLKNMFFEKIECDSYKYLNKMIKQYERMEEGLLEFNKTSKLKEFQKLFLQFLKRMVTQVNDGQSFVIALLESSFLEGSSFIPSKWEKILHIVQYIKHFQHLLEILFKMAGKGHKNAKSWLIALLPSLKQLKKEWAIFQILLKENDSYEPKKFKKKIRLRHRETNHKLIIKLDIKKPPVINLKMMNEILLNPETMPLTKIISYLKMVRPRLPKNTTEAFVNLLSIQKVGKIENDVNEAKQNGDEENENQKIFTVNDLENIVEEQVSMINEEDEDEDGLEGWVQSKIDIQVWSKCPLGLLPFQTKVDCSLPADLTWKREKVFSNEIFPSVTNHFSDVNNVELT